MLVVSGNNCKPISYPIAIENVSGIITANKTEINIYPNPASNFVIIEFENEPNENSYFSIYSQTGQLVATIDIKNRINKIDIDKLALGNYFLKVVNGDKESSVVLTKE
ncbi:MAG: T9SS type A sorting domain-containing protein [Bacteroidales bacterium]|nr:T9SS type A sorting domain-containing protein [Bacteroidales bacterium]